ncbi:MAG: hypothetical protein RR416_04890 [Clostridia bacterium]
MKDSELAKLKALEMFENDDWIRWIHEGTVPAHSNVEKLANIALSISALGKHCSRCLNINGCCFPRNNMPQFPLHLHCHCRIESIYKITAKAECELDKFTNYIFIDKGKKTLFKSWGYDIIDSEWLQAEFIRQAKEKYENGDFGLGKLDDFGQRINIVITLRRKDKIGMVKFTTGWMVYPDGVIKLTTPYGGK